MLLAAEYGDMIHLNINGEYVDYYFYEGENGQILAILEGDSVENAVLANSLFDISGLKSMSLYRFSEDRGRWRLVPYLKLSPADIAKSIAAAAAVGIAICAATVAALFLAWGMLPIFGAFVNISAMAPQVAYFLLYTSLKFLETIINKMLPPENQLDITTYIPDPS